jgi:hypothetical protein
MDAGRYDGSGPSKQDPVQDGAGCQVAGIYTFDGIDETTGMVYCQVRINAGSAINLAKGISSGLLWLNKYEVPVGVKVLMERMEEDEYDLKGSGEGTAAKDVRGITGIKILHPTQIETK